MKRNFILAFIALLTLAGLTTKTEAQTASIVSDSQKQKQWASMELTNWDFAPDYYYYLFHKNYSGAELYWTMTAGFVPTPHVRFKESESNVKRILVPRTGQVPAEVDIKSKTQAQLDTINPIHADAVARALERNIDMVYSQYETEFADMQNAIAKNLNFCLEKSKGKLLDVIESIQRQNDLLLENITYTHKTGLGYELENTKRQESYEESMEKMKKVLGATNALVMYSKVYY